MYLCRICQFSKRSPYDYMQHYRIHSNAPNFPCGVGECSRTFRKLSSFYSHVSRDHQLLKQRRRLNMLQNVAINATCQVEGCRMLLPLMDLVKHLKQHISDGTSIHCPASGCGRKMRSKSTFSAHLSIKHGCLSKVNVDQSIVCDAEPATDSFVTGTDDDDITFSADDINNEDLGGEEVASVIPKDALIDNIAMFLLKLQCKCLIPASTIDLISSELHSLHTLSLDNITSLVKIKLEVAGMHPDIVDRLLSSLHQEDAFHLAFNGENGLLRSQHKRNSFYVNSLRYVAPQQYFVGHNKYGKACFIHYVPIRESLKSLLCDRSVLECLNVVPHSQSNGVFEDIHSGSVFHDVSCTVPATEQYLQLILYQDAFSIVNPLGSAKRAYKILAFYFTLGNFPQQLRMKIDNLQLVLLCNENHCRDFSHDKLFDALMQDLKHLEDNGVTINNKKWNVRLLAVLGDNLGSHWLGGFTTNFSSNPFPCRYCLVHRNPQVSDSIAYTAEVRTVFGYDTDAVVASTGTVSHGVVKQSFLNGLNHFHVCMPGLPPCLGHDLFEGIVQYDLALLLRRLSHSNSEHRVTLDSLNRAIKMFKFAGGDAHDKPGIISEGKTIGGHAMQNWCLLRLIPLLLFNIVDTCSSAWQMLLLLREIVELVCAPKISMPQILYLNRLVTMYVEDRLQLFPESVLRPKHHYLLHYGWLITVYGPLIHVWTMRMECKHTYFKRCVRSTHNFINVTKTLSETHQLNQAYMSRGLMLNDTIELGQDSVAYDTTLFAEAVISAISVCLNLQHPLQCSSRLIAKGTEYKKDAFVILRCIESSLVFGKIILCLLDCKGLGGLVVTVCKPAARTAIGTYIAECGDSSSMTCLTLNEIWDYYPLPGYCINGALHIVLKHSPLDTCYSASVH